MDTEALATWRSIAQVAAFCLAGLAAFAAGAVWFTGRELDRRRSADEARLHDRVTKSEEAAAAARRDAEHLRERLAPRTLSATQREKLLNQLRGVQGRALIVYPGDPEAEGFARQLHEAIAAAGWTAFLEGVATFGPVVGLEIKVRNTETAPAAMRTLHSGLEAVLGPVLVESDQNLAPDAIQVVVGSKPSD